MALDIKAILNQPPTYYSPGAKIEMIKALRSTYPVLTLIQSKELVEAFLEEVGKELAYTAKTGGDISPQRSQPDWSTVR